MTISMKSLLLSASVLSVTGLTSACAEVESEDVSTDGLFAHYYARVDEERTVVSASFTVGSGGAGSTTHVELTGDDKVKATLGEDTKLLEKANPTIDLNMPHYNAHFDAIDPDTEIVIAFERSVDDGAPESKLTLPTLPEAEGPEGEPSRAEDDITIRFSENGEDERTEVKISGECFQEASKTAESGASEVVFGQNALKEPEAQEGEDAPEPATCEATVTITRIRKGSLDKAFTEGGIIEASRQETLTFNSAP